MDVLNKTIEQLREQGCAVIIWTPKELGSANPTHVEDREIEVGHQIIKDLQ